MNIISHTVNPHIVDSAVNSLFDDFETASEEELTGIRASLFFESMRDDINKMLKDSFSSFSLISVQIDGETRYIPSYDLP